MSASPPPRIDALLAEVRTTLPPRPTAADLAALRARRALIVDIRPAAQRAQDGELPGAVVIERNVLEWRLDPTSPDRLFDDLDEDREIVVVCNEGYASSLAAASLQQLGLRKATDLDGGVQAILARERRGRGSAAAIGLVGLVTILLTTAALLLAGVGPATAQAEGRTHWYVQCHQFVVLRSRRCPHGRVAAASQTIAERPWADRLLPVRLGHPLILTTPRCSLS